MPRTRTETPNKEHTQPLKMQQVFEMEQQDGLELQFIRLKGSVPVHWFGSSRSTNQLKTITVKSYKISLQNGGRGRLTTAILGSCSSLW